MSGFEYRGRVFGGNPTVRKMILLDGADVSIGEIVCASTSGTIQTASSATGPTQLWGVATGEQAESSGSYVEVVVDPDAIYAITDATTRYAGDTLSVSAGGSAVVTAAASNSGMLVVYANSGSVYETQVVIVPGNHVLGRFWTGLATTGSRIA